MTSHVTPKKALGQHFLADTNIARKVADSLSGHGGYAVVLEVGPGTGMLSRHLMDREDFRWQALEADRESVAYLHQRYPGMKSNVAHGDMLKYDLQASFGDDPVAIIGNFPYNISSQIIFRMLLYRKQVTELVGMFQKEVACRIASPPGSKVYGILSVLVQAFYNVELLFDVPPHVFVPPPKVISSVIRCKRKEDYVLDCDEHLFFSVVKTAFNQRRKTLRNSLKGMNISWGALPESFPGERPEQLGVSDFVNITRAVIR